MSSTIPDPTLHTVAAAATIRGVITTTSGFPTVSIIFLGLVVEKPLLKVELLTFIGLVVEKPLRYG
jgi:hypothetical protein